MENYRIGGVRVDQIKQGTGTRGKPANSKARDDGFVKQLDKSFKKISNLKFSGHAVERLRDRGVTITGETAQRLESAIEVAQQKGSRDSLVLLDELAFVVSVKNRTVITACNTQNMKEGVFTKIDTTILG